MSETDIRILTQLGIAVGAYLVGMWITFIYLGIKNARDFSNYQEMEEIEWFTGVLWPFALVLLTYSFICKAFSWFYERIPDGLLKVLGVLTIPFRPYRFGHAVGRFFMGVSDRRDGK